MQFDRSRPDVDFPEEHDRGGTYPWDDLEDAAVHPGNPLIYPPLEDEEDIGDERELS